MSLDDIIKNSKKSGFGNSRGRGRGRPSGAGPARRFPIRAANRAAPYTAAKAPESTWQHDMFRNQSGRTSSLEGNKLYVSNLDYGVSNEDIKMLSAFEILVLVVPAVPCQNIIMTSISYTVRGRGGALGQLRGGSGSGRGFGRGRGRGRGRGEKW
ncbi:RNA-BINDING (RRM/RBD/RNP MOTIFS) FAMILY PROTEIN-RELATED [Salix purpurea]|uniref:RNA-BINDING (RRM/RBD/RNP MOTIFS) FAMILY PROTEIN-RELATED n=1 Tax=Salix purpurea TaxID=77065 RepID=A0A9Q0PNV5_SALPP|nr:RNA-BINDING (RRM/RBD/RNP MOTIFS) FAMILY PROTEIN-RELATED [Salix purpurea]